MNPIVAKANPFVCVSCVVFCVLCLIVLCVSSRARGGGPDFRVSASTRTAFH